MKHLKWFVLLVAMLATFIYAQDARTRAYIHAMLVDSAAVMRKTMHDTADVVRSDMRGESRDSIIAVWNDSAVVVLRKDGSVALTANWAAGDFDITGLEKVETDTLTVGVDAVITGNTTTDSVDAQHVVGDVHVTTDSIDAQHLAADVHITTDSIDAQHIVGDVHVQTDSIQSNHIVLVGDALLWTTPRDTSTQVWVDSAGIILGEDGSNALTGNWEAGDFDITTLEKLEADTVAGTVCLESSKWFMGQGGVGGTGQVAGNILDIVPPVYVGVGDADTTMISDGCIQTDSVQVDDWLKVDDSLLIPSWAAAPATGSSGLFGADSANDTIVAFCGGSRLIVYPASGAGIAADKVRDTINAWWGDTTDVVVLIDGTNPLTADWAAGDFDVTGLEKVEADTVQGSVHMLTLSIAVDTITVSKVAITDSVESQHTVADVHVQTDSLQANHITLIGDQILWATYRDTSTVVFNDSIAVVKVPRTLVWYYDGDVEAAEQFGMTYIPEQELTVNDIKLHVETAPANQSLIVDINEAGTTIFSTNPEIDADGTREDDNHAISDNTIAAGAEVTLDIDQVGTGTAGASLTVILECEQATVR